MAKTRIFVSFDFDNDRVLRDLVIGQARLPGSPFEVAEHSLKEASREALWERKAHAAIGCADFSMAIDKADAVRRWFKTCWRPHLWLFYGAIVCG